MDIMKLNLVFSLEVANGIMLKYNFQRPVELSLTMTKHDGEN